MKLSVEFPSLAYREGPKGVARMAKAIERIGFDQLDIFDHVVMGYPAAGRPKPVYPPKMPILEALTTLAYAAAVTQRIGLGTEVLVLPQRQPLLVAKQVSTLDVLCGGRMRLGVGIGWQESEYEALGEDFGNRGRRFDEAIALLRAAWGEEQLDFAGEFYNCKAMALEPKPPQGAKLPIWLGGAAPRALQRVGELADGWLATAVEDKASGAQMVQTVRRHAAAAGRGPSGHRPADDAGRAAPGCPRQGFLHRYGQRAAPGGRCGRHGLRLGRHQRHRHLSGGFSQPGRHHRQAGGAAWRHQGRSRLICAIRRAARKKGR